MIDQFDTFLAAALAPEERAPDRAFTLRVNAAILIDDRLRAARRAALRELGLQIVAILSVAAALVGLLRSEVIAEFAAGYAPLTLGALLLLFALLLGLVIRPASTRGLRLQMSDG